MEDKSERDRRNSDSDDGGCSEGDGCYGYPKVVNGVVWAREKNSFASADAIKKANEGRNRGDVYSPQAYYGGYPMYQPYEMNPGNTKVAAKPIEAEKYLTHNSCTNCRIFSTNLHDYSSSFPLISPSPAKFCSTNCYKYFRNTNPTS